MLQCFTRCVLGMFLFQCVVRVPKVQGVVVVLCLTRRALWVSVTRRAYLSDLLKLHRYAFGACAHTFFFAFSLSLSPSRYSC